MQAAWALDCAKIQHAWLIIDNLMTVNGVKSTIGGGFRDHTDYYALWRRFAALTSQIDLRCDHVPSHGKRPDWRPPAGEDAAMWRRLNGRADTAASEALDNLCFAAQELARGRHAVRQWSHSAMLAQLARVEELWARYPPDPKWKMKKAQKKRAAGGFAAVQNKQMLSEVIKAAKRPRRAAKTGNKRTPATGPTHTESSSTVKRSRVRQDDPPGYATVMGIGSVKRSAEHPLAGPEVKSGRRACSGQTDGDTLVPPATRVNE